MLERLRQGTRLTPRTALGLALLGLVELYRALLLTWLCAVGLLAGIQFRLAALIAACVGKE